MATPNNKIQGTTGKMNGKNAAGPNPYTQSISKRTSSDTGTVINKGTAKSGSPRTGVPAKGYKTGVETRQYVRPNGSDQGVTKRLKDTPAGKSKATTERQQSNKIMSNIKKGAKKK
jgi:hypothetical protein